MIEINEVIPFYTCNKTQDCRVSVTCGDCVHTQCEIFAKNANAVEIYNLFCDTFGCIVDDYGRLLVYEKEKDDGKK